MEVLKVLEEMSDPRAKDFFLINSIGQTLIIVTSYILFCKKIGPALMENRKPFKLHRIIQIYNLTQVVSCTAFFVTACVVAYKSDLTFYCDPIKETKDYWTLKIIDYHWYYFMLKLFDFVDTVFFVLRKKNSHITFLHVYHHSSMFMMAWLTTKFVPGGQSALVGLLNTFVHIIMYTYYFLSSLGPKYRKHLWWKKHLTQLQLVQFIILAYQLIVPSFVDCGFPKSISFIFSTQAVIFLILFIRFYMGTYGKKQTAKNVKGK